MKANQLCLLKSENYEHLSKNLSLKFDKENIIRCYSRLENKTEKVLHNGVKQTLNEGRNAFWINRG